MYKEANAVIQFFCSFFLKISVLFFFLLPLFTLPDFFFLLCVTTAYYEWKWILN